MNIFWLAEDPVESCSYYVDSHVVKMPLEHCQLLSSALRLTQEVDDNKYRVYKTSHINHPCSTWARASLQNWLLLRDLTAVLCQEYTYRYGKTHTCQVVLEQLPTPTNLPSLGVTTRPQAMPEDCKQQDTVAAYRDLYRKHKTHLFKWKKRPRPLWLLSNPQQRFLKTAPPFTSCPK